MASGVGGPLFPGIHKRADDGSLLVFSNGAWVASSASNPINITDAAFTIVGDLDATKKLVTQVDTQATASTLTLDVGAQTTSRTLLVPVLAGTDTLATLNVANTFTQDQSISKASATLNIDATTGSAYLNFKAATVLIGYFEGLAAGGLQYVDNTNVWNPLIYTVGDSTAGYWTFPGTKSATASNAGAFRVGDGAAATTVAIGAGKLFAGDTIKTKQAAAAGIQLDHNSATGDFTGSFSPANLTANRRWTFPDADFTLTGGGTLALGGFTLTVPATGTAALLAVANNFTAINTFSNATASTSISTGAVVLSAGGLGVAGAIYAGGSLSAGTRAAIGTAIDASYGLAVKSGSLHERIRITMTGAGSSGFYLTDATVADGGTVRWDSTDQILIYPGGGYGTYALKLGASAATFTYQLNVSATTDSTTKDTGSIVTEGGIGVEKAVVIGTSLTVGTTTTHNGNVTMADAINLIVNATTGTKIATATTQKLGFWNATPIIQPASANQAAVATTAATNVAPYGYTTAAQADGIITLLNEIRLALVNAGIIKGAA